MYSYFYKYLYRKYSEYYNCNLDIIIEKIKKCIKFEKTCKNCNDINQIGGSLNITEILLTNYKNKLDNYINIFNEFNK